MDRTSTKTAAATLRQLLHKTGLSHRLYAKLTGRAQRTVNAHANGGTVPREAADWLGRVREVRVSRGGRAVIVLDMPVDTPDGEYLRADVVKMLVGVKKAPKSREP
jgi:hypothetical protein